MFDRKEVAEQILYRNANLRHDELMEKEGLSEHDAILRVSAENIFGRKEEWPLGKLDEAISPEVPVDGKN